MGIILFLILIPFLYCLATLILCSIYDFSINKKGFIFPINSLLYESLIQYFVFIFLPIDLLRKWERYESNTNKIAILLPGYSETQFIFWNLRKELKKNKIGFKTIKYKTLLGDLTIIVKKLENEINIILKNNNESDIYIIGHSMGGLIGRKFMENHYYTNIRCLIMISTPHQGTIIGQLGIGKCSKQMTPNSNFIKTLSKIPIDNTLNLYSTGDSLVCPRISAIYMKNNFKIINQPLHNATVFSRDTAKLIIERIKYEKYN